MDNNNHQGSKRSHDQASTPNSNKHQNAEEQAPKRHKGDFGRPSSSASDSTSARDNRATGSSTMPRRLSQGPPVTFSGPPQSTALRAIEEMQGIRRDAGNTSASGGPGRTSRQPSEPGQAKPGSAQERKVSASSSGPSILRRNSASGLIPRSIKSSLCPSSPNGAVPRCPAPTAPSHPLPNREHRAARSGLLPNHLDHH
ncbi:hypothetical protein PG997_008648 [Apiospora hydei]|uniref:Uncharacterized protein n=1 Tax=Apiospora hydei TaxID=1337664 RepID=A0ABR1WBF7_9PEZI